MKKLKVRYISDYGYEVTATGLLLGSGYVDAVKVFIHDEDRPDRHTMRLIKDEATLCLLDNENTPEVRF